MQISSRIAMLVLGMVLACSSASAKVGYIDRTGKVVINPDYDEAGSFCDSLAKVKKGNKSFFIDTTGKVAIDPHCAVAGDFAEGLAPVEKGNNVWIYQMRRKASLFRAGMKGATASGVSQEFVVVEYIA